MLHRFVLSNDLEGLTRALSNGPQDVTTTDADGFSAMHYAAAYNEPGMLQLLIDHASATLDHPNRQGNTPLHIAVAHGALACVTLLVNQQAPLNAGNVWNERPLHVAAAAGHKREARVLITAGASLDVLDRWEQSPIDVAKEHREADMAAFLERAKEGHVDDQPPADAPMGILKLKSHSLVKLIEAPLDEAQFAQWMANRSIDINGKDFFGQSVLSKLMAWNKHASVTMLLADKRFDPALLVAKAGGETPLHLAVQMGALRAVDVLLAHDPSLGHVPNDDGITPLEMIKAISAQQP